jgi:flagellar basal body rod protein FlgG
MDLLLTEIQNGLAAADRSLSLYAQEVANVATPGFQALTPLAVALPAEPVTSAVSVTAGADVVTRRDLAQGPLVPGVSPEDVAISGPGYFVVSRGGQTYYTRLGAFQTDGQGRLALPDGSLLLSTKGTPIALPAGATSVSISSQGVVRAGLPGGGSALLGQVQVVTFPNPDGLQGVGGGLLAASPASGLPTAAAATLVPGMLEQSNVDLAQVLPELMVAVGAFRAQADLASVDQQMGQRLDQLVG